MSCYYDVKPSLAHTHLDQLLLAVDDPEVFAVALALESCVRDVALRRNGHIAGLEPSIFIDCLARSIGSVEVSSHDRWASDPQLSRLALAPLLVAHVFAILVDEARFDVGEEGANRALDEVIVGRLAC